MLIHKRLLRLPIIIRHQTNQARRRVGDAARTHSDMRVSRFEIGGSACVGDPANAWGPSVGEPDFHQAYNRATGCCTERYETWQWQGERWHAGGWAWPSRGWLAVRSGVVLIAQWSRPSSICPSGLCRRRDRLQQRPPLATQRLEYRCVCVCPFTGHIHPPLLLPT